MIAPLDAARTAQRRPYQEQTLDNRSNRLTKLMVLIWLGQDFGALFLILGRGDLVGRVSGEEVIQLGLFFGGDGKRRGATVWRLPRP